MAAVATQIKPEQLQQAKAAGIEIEVRGDRYFYAGTDKPVAVHNGAIVPANMTGVKITRQDAVLTDKDGKVRPEAPERPTPKPLTDEEIIASSPPEGKSDTSDRTSPTGVKQTGKTLGGLDGINQMLSGLTRRDGSSAGISLADTKGMYSSEALPTTPGGSRQLDGRTEGEKSEGYTKITPDNPIAAKAFGQDWVDKFKKTGKRGHGQKSSGFASADGTVDTEAPSVAGTIQEEDGQVEQKVSGADQSRVVKGVNGAVFGGEGPDTADLVAPMYSNKNRNTYRAHFLDDSMDSMTALRAAQASQGYVVQNGRTFENQGGKLHEIDPDKAADYRNEKAWGRDPGQKFKDGYLKAVVEAGKGGGTTDSPDTKEDGSDTSSSAVPTYKPTEQEFDTSKLSAKQQELVKGTGVVFSTKGMTDDNAGDYLDRFKALQ